MERGRIFVVGERLDGSRGAIDVFDLDEESWRGWVIDVLSGLPGLPISSAVPPPTGMTPKAVHYRQAAPRAKVEPRLGGTRVLKADEGTSVSPLSAEAWKQAGELIGAKQKERREQEAPAGE